MYRQHGFPAKNFPAGDLTTRPPIRGNIREFAPPLWIMLSYLATHLWRSKVSFFPSYKQSFWTVKSYRHRNSWLWWLFFAVVLATAGVICVVVLCVRPDCSSVFNVGFHSHGQSFSLFEDNLVTVSHSLWSNRAVSGIISWVTLTLAMKTTWLLVYLFP